MANTVRARPGQLSALSVSHSESVLYGAFLWARGVLNGPKRRFPARAVFKMHAGFSTSLRGPLSALFATMLAMQWHY